MDSKILELLKVEILEELRRDLNQKEPSLSLDSIKRVMFRPPVTIVQWTDGSKTIVRTTEGDEYVPEVGLSLCIVKKVLGKDYHKLYKTYIDNNPVLNEKVLGEEPADKATEEEPETEKVEIESEADKGINVKNMMDELFPKENAPKSTESSKPSSSFMDFNANEKELEF